MAKSRSDLKAKAPNEGSSKGGRPSIRTAENADKICEWIAEGKSLVWITKQDGVPSYAAVAQWLGDDEEFRKRYARAHEDQADYLFDEILAIADDGRNDTYSDEKGNRVVDHDNIQRSKLRVAARQWMAAKLKPKKYGDKLDVERGGMVKHLTLDELRQRVEEAEV